MTRTGINPALARLVNTRKVITPAGVWALVVPGVRVVAPFVGVGDVERYAGDLGLPSGGYAALPFVRLGRISIR
ncbi:hypothetical protein [Frankia sp. CiP3]|uniref:hypothetical protein n=1 Tax=Frankia sp. CiP3 TaxID=2880971 RepID=UPI001EF5BE94|nr:hypothetical protein [Frankia sp. CiP3]